MTWFVTSNSRHPVMPKEADAKGVASWDLLLGPQPSYKHLQPQKGTVLNASRGLWGV